MLLNIGLVILAMLLCYQLALAFVGVTRKPKQLILPIFIFSVITYISKIVLEATPTVHTIVLVITCGLLLWIIDKIELVISFIASLLTFITITIGSIMIWLPLLLRIGINLPKNQSGIEWFLLNFSDLLTIILVTLLLRMTKFSITRFLPEVSESQ